MKLTNEVYDDEGSTLSADAVPFHPYYEPVNIVIYNDGVPSMMLTSEQDRFDLLHGIEDQALDDQFPPDAEDAFELEAAEAFVMEMANLAILEELEEKSRRTFCHLQKRWEVRRAAGPTGRPRPAMHLIVPVHHSTVKKSTQQFAIVHHTHHRLMTHEKTLATKSAQRIDPRVTKSTVMYKRPIQQPRKNS